MFTNGVSENLLDHQHFLPEEEVQDTLLKEVIDICIKPYMKGKDLADAPAASKAIVDLAYRMSKDLYRSPDDIPEEEERELQSEEPESKAAIMASLDGWRKSHHQRFLEVAKRCRKLAREDDMTAICA